jgi:hypothetical protein
VATWLTFRSRLRTRWAVWLGLVALVGATAGIVMVGLAGARHTASAHDRFVEQQRGYDVAISVDCGVEFERRSRFGPGCVDEIAASPSVADATAVETFDAFITTTDGRSVQPEPTDPCYSGQGRVDVMGDRSGRFGNELNETRIVAGRRADPAAPDEVVLSKSTAERLGLGPGSTLRVSLFGYGDCQEPAAWRPPMSLRVVGIGLTPGEVPPPSGGYLAAVHVTPAFVRLQAPAATGAFIPVRLRATADTEALLADIERIGGRAETILDANDLGQAVTRGMRPHAVALAVVATLIALAGACILGQTLARQIDADAADEATLVALGMSSGGRFASALLPAAFFALVAGVMAGLVAVALSPLTPLGPAAAIEPDPGLFVDAVVLAVGVVATVVFVIAITAMAAWRRSRTRPRTVATSRGTAAAAGAMRRAGSPPTVVSGVHMALDRGRGRVPVLTSVSALVLAIVTVVGSLTFGAGLDQLLDTPRLRGVNWDLYLFDPARIDSDGEKQPIERDRVQAVLTDARTVEAFSTGMFWPPFPGGSPLEMGPERRRVAMLGFSAAGGVGPSVVHGRAPAASDEVLVGPETLDDLGLDVGDTVELYGRAGSWNEPGPETRLRARIVGVGIIPIAGGEARLGRGAALTVEGIQRLNADAAPDGYWLRFTEGSDADVVVAGLLDELGAVPAEEPGYFDQSFFVTAALDVREPAQLNRVPEFFAVVMAIMAVGVLALLLVNALRANRRDLAVMRALGFRRGDIQRAVAWQAIVYASLALAIGVPLGVAAGRVTWQAYAVRLGAVPEPVVPWAALGLVTAATLMLAGMCGLGLSRRRAAARPATALRSE